MISIINYAGVIFERELFYDKENKWLRKNARICIRYMSYANDKRNLRELYICYGIGVKGISEKILELDSIYVSCMTCKAT